MIMTLLKSVWTYVVLILMVAAGVAGWYAVHSYRDAIQSAATATSALASERNTNSQLRQTNAYWAREVSGQNLRLVQLRTANDTLQQQLLSAEGVAVDANVRAVQAAHTTVAQSVSPQCQPAMDWLGTRLRTDTGPW